MTLLSSQPTCSRNLPPPKVKRRRGNVYAKLTLIMFPDVTLLQEIYNNFLLVSPFRRFFFSTTVALFTNVSRNGVDVEIQFCQRGTNRTSSSSYSIQKSLIIFSFILKSKASRAGKTRSLSSFLPQKKNLPRENIYNLHRA